MYNIIVVISTRRRIEVVITRTTRNRLYCEKYRGFESHRLRQAGHLSKSEPPRFGQRQVFCYNSFYNAVLRLLNPDFKIDTKSKTAQNWILNMKKGGIRTPSVRFELWKLCILLRYVNVCPFSACHFTPFADTNAS